MADMDPAYALLSLDWPAGWPERLFAHNKKGLGFSFDDVRVWVRLECPRSLGFTGLKKEGLLFVQFEYPYPGTGKWRSFRRDLCPTRELDRALEEARQHLKSFGG